MININKPILITGAAGFIGFHLAKRLLASGKRIIGFDNLNSYYDVELKKSRLKDLETYKDFCFIKGDLINAKEIDGVFRKYNFEIVVNLAAQAGVRYSIENPNSYIETNIIGFFHLLEACRNHGIKHLLFASSSSVYGNQKKVPFSVDDCVDYPVSLYAATKKSNELMAYTYSHLHRIPATGLRFFTVYGPYGRPDMAYFKFTKKICCEEKIEIYNQGDLYRDFTYIDDVIDGIERILFVSPKRNIRGAAYSVYNIGNHHPEKLMDFISILEELLGKVAHKKFLPMQPGDVWQTYADITALERDFGFQPKVSIREGLQRFVEWYREYYG